MMMVRVLKMAAVIALVGAGVVFGICIMGWVQDDPPPPLASLPSALEAFQREGLILDDLAIRPPLIVQAENLAAYLNPPQPEQLRQTPVQTVAKPVSPRVAPPITPVTVTPRFKVYATSFCSEEPGRSMVLISEPGGQTGLRRWVNEGAQLSHFVIQEIRKGSIVCREANSERVLEMAVEHESPRNLLAPSQAGLARAGGRTDENAFDVNLSRNEVQQ